MGGKEGCTRPEVSCTRGARGRASWEILAWSSGFGVRREENIVLVVGVAIAWVFVLIDLEGGSREWV